MKKWLLILMLIPGLMHAMALHTDDISSSDVVLLCLHDDLDKKNILKDENSFFEDLEVIQPDVIQDMKKDEDSDEIVISSMPEKPSRKRKALIIASTRIQNNALDTKPTDTAQRRSIVECPQCSKRVQFISLDKHRWLVHGKGAKPAFCTVAGCKKPKTAIGKLADHTRKSHNYIGVKKEHCALGCPHAVSSFNENRREWHMFIHHSSSHLTCEIPGCTDLFGLYEYVEHMQKKHAAAWKAMGGKK